MHRRAECWSDGNIAMSSVAAEGSIAPDLLLGELQPYGVYAHMHRQLNQTRDVGLYIALRHETSPLPSPHSPTSATHCNPQPWSTISCPPGKHLTCCRPCEIMPMPRLKTGNARHRPRLGSLDSISSSWLKQPEPSYDTLTPYRSVKTVYLPP